MPLLSRKRTALEAFVDEDLGCCTASRAKLVMTGFLEPVNTVMARGAIIMVSNSKDKGNQDIDSTKTDHEDTSGKAALDEKMINKPDQTSTALDNQVEDREIKRQMPGKGSGNL